MLPFFRSSLSSLLGVIIAVALFSSSHPAEADTRVALVIGNSAYQKSTSLRNPVHDAEDMDAALQRLGFKVSAVHDADFSAFRKALLDFNRAAQGADIAVVYFAGHGIEIDGENWLLPTDVELHSDVDASTEAISLRSVMSAVGPAKTLGLVILDACRNNPFLSTMLRSAAQQDVRIGLGAVETSDNILVAYAARDGTVAVDGTGRNSPFTSALLRHLATPGLEVDFLFRNVRDDVRVATSDTQQPFVYGSLSSDEIYLNPPLSGQAEPAGPLDAAEIAWSFLKSTDDAGALTRFAERFPASAFASDAKARIASLASTATSRPGAGETVNRPMFRENAPDNAELEEAEKAIARRFMHDGPAVKAAWDIIRESKDHVVIRRFVDQFPSGQRRLSADRRLADLGQRPISPRTMNFRPIASPFASAAVAPLDGANLPEDMARMAGQDADVIACFSGGDRGACDRALVRYPEIPRLPASPLFLACLCRSLGQPKPTCPGFVDTHWNFPILKTVVTATAERIEMIDEVAGIGTGGNGAGTGANGSGTSGNGAGTGGSGGTVADVEKRHDRHIGGNSIGKANRFSRIHDTKLTTLQGRETGTDPAKIGHVGHFRAGGRVRLDAAATTPDVKVSNPKTTVASTHVAPAAMTAPRVNVPTVRTPAVNVRVPTINVPVRLPGH